MTVVESTTDPGLLVETSALVAILLRERDAAELIERIEAASCKTTAVNVFEAILAVSYQRQLSPTEARNAVLTLGRNLGIEIVGFAPEMLGHAVGARERYGRGRKRLNMGDCLSYGAAKQLSLKLLFKGDDFARTDVNQ